MSHKQTPSFHNSLRSQITLRKLLLSLVGGIALLSGLLMLTKLAEETSMEHCSTCTQLITGLDNSTFTFSGGEVLCITASGNFSGTINHWSGNGTVRIVNEGIFDPVSLNFNKGENIVDNYGSSAPGTISFNNGASLNRITNYAGGTFSPTTFALKDEDGEFHNYGTFSPSSLTISGGAVWYNYAGAEAILSSLSINTGTVDNRATIRLISGSLTLNSSSLLINSGLIELAQDLKLNGNSELRTTGSMEIGRDLVVNNAEVDNSGSVSIGRNFTINGGGEVRHSGSMGVEEDLTINNDLEGPESGNEYGSIEVGGITTINGGGKVSGNIDICDAGSPSNGLDSNYGNTDPSVTYCVHRAGASNLPIELTSFEAMVEDGRILLLWETAREINNDYFSVERSANGIEDFASIGQVVGAGNSESVESYAFEDEQSLSGRSYYRLRQVDFDGKFSFSHTLEATLTLADQFSVKLFPNPATDYLRLQIESPQEISGQIQLLNMQGQVLHQQPVSLLAGRSETEISLTSLSAATYLIRVQQNNGQQIGSALRFVKR